MESKTFRSISEQIELLKSKNLKFIDEPSAAQHLSNFGYYEIINGYRDTFIDDNKKFKSDTTFEDIFALFYFDFKLRSALLETLDYAEVSLKQKLAYTLAEKYGLNFDDYISIDVFDVGSPLKRPSPELNLYSSRDLLFYELGKIRDKNVHPFKHYREHHELTPPWILVKGMTFGNLRSAITLLKQKDKSLLINRLYSPEDVSNITEDELKTLFHETIRIINRYRNRAAHGGRLYNFFPSVGFKYSTLLHEKAGISKTSITKNKVASNSLYLLLMSMSFWQSKYPFATFKMNFENILTGYSSKWKKQIPLILKEMQMPEDFVKIK